MQEVKRIGVMSAAKILGLFGILIGLVGGIAIAILSNYAAVGEELPVMFFGWQSIIIFPVFYAVVYFIAGALGALIYNLLAKMIGGIKIDLKK